MKLRSIRLRLPLTYAGIALLAALALAAVLLFTLRGYYAGLERRRLASNAGGIAAALAQLLESGASQSVIAGQVNSWAFFIEARVRLQDPGGRLLADSGYPDVRRLVTVSNPPGSRVLVQKHTGPGDVTYAGVAEPITETVGLPSWQVYILPAGEPVSDTLSLTQVQSVQGGEVPVLENYSYQIQPQRRDDTSAGQPVRPAAALIYRFEGPGTAGVAVSGSEVEVAAPLPDVLAPVQADEPVGLAVPVSRSLYGFGLSVEGGDEPREALAISMLPVPAIPRSDQVVARPITAADGRRLGVVVLSDGPAYGSEIVNSVARGWLFSCVAAVLLAALVGWWMSRRLTGPLLALTAATARMAAGDLGARADLHSDDELGDLSRSFNEMAGRVQNTVQTLQNFVGDAAHQLHTPLTALDAYLELARDEPDASRRRDYLSAAESQAARLQALIDGLLELSRLEDKTAAHAPFDLVTLAAGLAELFASRAEQAGLQFHYRAPSQPVIITGHPGQVREALHNLLDNAFKFTPFGGTVELALEVEDHMARLTVSDSGIGLDPADLPRLFGRFYRGRNVSAYPGSGLGLAIVRSIAAAHHGHVDAERLPQGARFSLCLPWLPGE